MESINDLSRAVVKTTAAILSHESLPESCGTPEQYAIECAESRITWYINDVIRVLKNINETSLDNMDRARRLIELEEKYGIPKTHSILK